MKRILSAILAVALAATLLMSFSVTASATELKTGIGTINAEKGLCLREKDSLSSPVICVAPDGDRVVIIRESGDWYLVNYNLHIGYMHSDYIEVTESEEVNLGQGSLDADQTEFRRGASDNASIIDRLAAGEEVEILGLDDTWYEVLYHGTEGYIRSDLITLTKKPAENHGVAVKPAVERVVSYDSYDSSSGSSLGNSAGSEIANYALGFVGYPYVYGGSSPSGFDCSGFMQYIFRQFGININRTATAQLADGYAVSYDNMLPGDIVYFGYGNTASHVGMYIGGGQFVHAEDPYSGVVISSLSESYYASRFLCAHRIVG